MSLCPRYQVELSERTIRVRSEQGRLLVEEPLAVAMQYVTSGRKKTSGKAALLAMGDDAAHLPERVEEDLRRGEVFEPPVRFVSPELAVWWPPPPPGAPRTFAPAEHRGETLVVWPLEDGRCDPEALQASLLHMTIRALKADGRSWLLRPSLDLRHRLSLQDDAAHDAMARVLWSFAGRDRVTMAGAPLQLRRPRTWSDLPAVMWLRMVLVAFLPLGFVVAIAAAYGAGATSQLGGMVNYHIALWLVLLGLMVQEVHTWLRS